ncbi:hypothetical protein ACOSQ3_012801 [Xanthoceras sorbifolium]
MQAGGLEKLILDILYDDTIARRAHSNSTNNAEESGLISGFTDRMINISVPKGVNFEAVMAKVARSFVYSLSTLSKVEYLYIPKLASKISVY